MSTMSETVRPIDETIRQSLQDAGYGSYMSYAGPVIEALKARETALADELVDYAVDAGADVTEVQAYLKEIGMSVKDPEPEDQESAEPEDVLTSLDAKITSIAEMVNSLAQFARSNGFRG